MSRTKKNEAFVRHDKERKGEMGEEKTKIIVLIAHSSTLRLKPQ